MTRRTKAFRRMVAAVATFAGAVPASIVFAGGASAYGCYEAACVPNVVAGVAQGAPCDPLPRRLFAFGLEPDGATAVCSPSGQWVAAGALVGVYNVTQHCPSPGLSAQGQDGIALVCADMGGGALRWSHRVDIPG
jgi:hypothetical protein